MKVDIDMGAAQAGKPAVLDLEELLATRLLVQSNFSCFRWGYSVYVSPQKYITVPISSGIDR